MQEELAAESLEELAFATRSAEDAILGLGEASAVKLYYLRTDALTLGGVLQPLPLPDGFFALREEAPMPALRPAQK